MQLQQLPQRHTLKSTEAPGMLIVEELLRFPRRKALNHPPSILRLALYVKRRLGGKSASNSKSGFTPIPIGATSLSSAPAPTSSNSRVQPPSGKIALDKSLICDIQYLVDNCAWSAGACSRFSFSRQVFHPLPVPNNPKPRPLKSITYEMQIL